MARLFATQKARLRPVKTMLTARGRALRQGHPLPPGDTINIPAAEAADRTLLLRLAEQHGPLFRALYGGDLLVCVVGVGLGRRFLKEHAASLRPLAPRLEALFPKGFMRQMEGEDHREYRGALVRGLTALASDDMASDLEAITAAALDAYRWGPAAGPGAPQAYRNALSVIASSMLARLFFGAEPGSPLMGRLLGLYGRLGPDGFVWEIGADQKEAYGALRDTLRGLQETRAASPSPAFASSLLGRLSEAGPVDETLLGNLIYMVEAGRYDVHCLFRWLSHYGAENADWMDRIAAADRQNPDHADTLAEAFILETLRMDQSERLMRNVTHDIVFDGHTIPKNAMVRICLWESHKDEDVFADPFAFDPLRFLDTDGPGGAFSPFGLDHHHCPFSSVSIRLSTAFLRPLARAYTLESVGDGPAVRGVFHWEPATDFAVVLHPRRGAGQEVAVDGLQGLA